MHPHALPRAAAPVPRGPLADATPPRRTIGAIVALVDGEPITLHELDRACERLRRGDPDHPAADRRAQALEFLIDSTLARHCARALGIAVGDEALGQAARRLCGGADGEAAWQQACEAWQLSWTGVRAALHEQLLRQALHDAALARLAPQAVADDAPVEPVEPVEPGESVRRAVRLRQIMLSARQGPAPATTPQQRLQALRQRIVADGEDFAALARSLSIDGSARAGGDLGWLAQGQLPPEFESAIAALAPGEVSQPFASRVGWHLVQVVARREQRISAAERQAQARHQAREQAARALVASWIAERRARARIVYWPARAEQGLAAC
ncbi:MAG: Foldase protein PrsA [Paracidovorax wautersii]|uniref:peptidylprolyl isomerase n=1 Tax=Paracidovorax wautersii TaxID=1177982 RepID=A0A7V8FQ92_9BURK|nr:MAG: Foldase protein PrsA [Paracidovorax wautersii]